MTASAKRAPARKAAKRDKNVEDVQVDSGLDEDFDPTAPVAAPEFDPARAGLPDHPYGDKALYVFRPSDGSAPIVFPNILEVQPTQKFFWKIYNLNEMFQAFEWMKFAEVPRAIQEQVMNLGERSMEEQAEFFRGWFAPLTRPQGLEPPGES